MQFHALSLTPPLSCGSLQQKSRAELETSCSMPLTVPLCALLLVLSSSTSCLGTQYQDCLSYTSTHCGNVGIGYPFGKIGSGCGDPHFQLDCAPDDQPDTSPPLLNIGGNEYRILVLPSLANNDMHSMTIINNLFWASGSLCLSGNFIQWHDSFFHMTTGYTIVTFWKDCFQIPKDPGLPTVTFNACDDPWYYSLGSELDPHGTSFCKTHFQLPIKNLSARSNINQSLLWEGFEITWYDDPGRNESCSACLASNGSCGYNIAEPKMFFCHCPNGTSYTRGKCLGNGGPNKSAIIIGCSIGGAALIAIAVVLFSRFYAKRRKTHSRDLASGDMEAAILPRRKMGNLPIFSYEELRQATNCFHKENELGDGGFGSVYLGKLRDGRTVAVKRLYKDNSRRLEQFINEVQIFSTLNHPRVVRLYGCTSADSPELLLVYEFVPNGTLADHLHGDRRGPRGLPWDTRLNIAIQIAEALAFLHSVDPPIFHRDVKSSNILLDENFNVKLADFGLCRNVPVNASHVTTIPQGTPGYVDPEYHQYYQLTEKSDVYSFGVVLVEIISAKLAVDINRSTREINLAIMAISKIQEGVLHELVDPQLEMEMNDEVKVAISAVAELAFRCLASESDDRPQMKEIVAQLEAIKELWGICPSPDEQSVSFPNHKHWRSFPISLQEKWPILSSTTKASA